MYSLSDGYCFWQELPPSISEHATIRVFTASATRPCTRGQRICVHGHARIYRRADAHSNPAARSRLRCQTRAPICFNPQAAKTVLPHYELRTKLGIEGKTPTKWPRRFRPPTQGHDPETRSRKLCLHVVGGPSPRTGGPLHPHMMVFVPYYKNSMLATMPRAAAPSCSKMWQLPSQSRQYRSMTTWRSRRVPKRRAIYAEETSNHG